MRLLLLLTLPLVLGGCVARTAVSVVTAPVKAVGWTADKLTTSQSEADEKRGRELRKEEERAGKAERRRQKEVERQRRSMQRQSWDY